jgi:hypothetical protein
LGHVIAHLRKQPDDPALIGRENLDRHVLVEIDAADRLLLDRKLALSGCPLVELMVLPPGSPKFTGVKT